MTENKSFTDKLPAEAERREVWKQAVRGKMVEAGWLARSAQRAMRYESVAESISSTGEKR